MPVDESSEGDPCSLTLRCLNQEVLIEADKNPAKCGCAIQQRRVVQVIGAVFLCRDDVDVSGAQAREDRPLDVHVQVEPDGGQRCLRARKRAMRGDDDASARARSYSATWRSISWSIAEAWSR